MWWCAECKCEVPPKEVTFEETHAECGSDVIWITTEASAFGNDCPSGRCEL